MTANGSESSNIGNALKNLNWPTVALILATGGGNWLATHETSNQLSYDQAEAIAKIRELHKSMDEFEARQRQALEGVSFVLKNETEILENQKQIMAQLRK
jgi:hypothetical protein